MEKEIKIADFLTVIKRRLWLVVLITVLTTAASGAYSMYSKSSWVPLYPASTSILLTVNKPDVLNTMGVIIKDAVVLDKVIEDLQLNMPVKALADRVSFGSENESQIVKITVADVNPEVAARIANATADSFIRQIGSVLGIYDAKLLSEAKVEKVPSPINSPPSNKMGIGFAVGLVLSIGVILLLDSLNNSIESVKEAEKLLDLPILGTVSKMNKKNTTQKKNKRLGSLMKGGTMGA